MKFVSFALYVFRQIPSLVILNILVLILIGFADSAAILSLTPIVDILIYPTLDSASPITKRIIELMGQAGIPATVGVLLALFILLNAVRSLFVAYSSYFSFKTRFTFLRRIYLGAFGDFFGARWRFFSETKQGTLLNTFLREITVIGDAFSAMANSFSQAVQCLVFLAVPFFLSWQVSLISIACALLFALPFLLLGRVSYRFGQTTISTANDIGAVIQESLATAKVILGFGSQEQSRSQLAAVIHAHQSAAIRSMTLSHALRAAYYPFGIGVLAITVVAGKAYAMPASEIIVILYSFFKIIPLVADITAQKSIMDNFFPSYEQVQRLRRRAQELKQGSGSRPFPGLRQDLRLAAVSFSYPDGAPVLMDVTAVVPKGTMIAFVGHSGSGKSTLIDIIMGFNAPTSGQVTIDGVPLQEFDILSYRHRIGYVPQDSVLFNMTIRDNLRWAKERATDEEIRAACAQANATEFITALPEGYDTIVGDRGVRLSGGQVQRIALARAILRDPALLILDEATSSLDSRSERLIQQSIEAISKRTTVIVIAHRLSTIVNADRIYVLDNGTVAESGTYAELVRKTGLFGRMVELQFLEQKQEPNNESQPS